MASMRSDATGCDCCVNRLTANDGLPVIGSKMARWTCSKRFRMVGRGMGCLILSKTNFSLAVGSSCDGECTLVFGLSRNSGRGCMRSVGEGLSTNADASAWDGREIQYSS